MCELYYLVLRTYWFRLIPCRKSDYDNKKKLVYPPTHICHQIFGPWRHARNLFRYRPPSIEDHPNSESSVHFRSFPCWKDQRKVVNHTVYKKAPVTPSVLSFYFLCFTPHLCAFNEYVGDHNTTIRKKIGKPWISFPCGKESNTKQRKLHGKHKYL